MTARVLRRHVLAAPLAALAAPAAAQEGAAEQILAWVRASALTWNEILALPMALLRTGGIPAYSVAESEAELSEARDRARAWRVSDETEIARCRGLVSALTPAPRVGDDIAQARIDQILVDQSVAIDRLAAMTLFVEATGMRYVSGELPFTPVMRMCNYVQFAEVNWITAHMLEVGRLAYEPDTLVDLITRTSVLDMLVQSAGCTTYMHTLNGDGADHIAAGRSVLSASAGEMRVIAQRMQTADMSALGLIGEARQRIAPILPQLAALAGQHADRLDQTAAAWATLDAAQVLAVEDDNWPQFLRDAAPLLERANIQL